MTKSLTQIIPVLQGAIGPVILISGIGLLLLSLTNRFARILDRARALAHQLRVNAPERHPLQLELIRLLRLRALWNRASIGLASLSILFAATLILLLFVQALLTIESALPVILAFSLCLLCLVGSVVAFLWDIHLSIVTLQVELDDVADRSSKMPPG
jgi:hypothetical protein